MKEYAPMLDKDGNFYNFTLYDDQEIMDSIGILPNMDKLITKHYISKLSTVLNENHVNYRKAIRGEPQMFPCRHYSYTCHPQVIMDYLLSEIRTILQVFDKLGILTDEKKQIYSIYSTNYMDMDLYKWYTGMSKLLIS